MTSVARIGEFRVLSSVCVLGAVALLVCGCDILPRGEAPRTPAEFEGIVSFLDKHGEAIVLEGDGGSKVLVSPTHQGRIFTMKVGEVESTGLVNSAAIAAGEGDPNFNNYGGLDRFWLGPEAGQFGLYFDPGVDFTRDIWRVPPAFDRGAFEVVSKNEDQVVMTREMEVRNYSGTDFEINVRREVGVVPPEELPQRLGISAPDDIAYAGAYSVNTITNSGDDAWTEEGGLVSVWILGQFNPSDSTVIIGPFRPGSDEELGPAFNDDYFGRVSVETPDRMKTLGNAVLFRADSRREGKFGISQKRTTGLAGAMDFEKNLLTIVKFDVPESPEKYANSAWVKVQPDPFKGDALQSYNAGPAEKGSGELAPVPFFELESTSPVRALAPGESIRHGHATYHFQGDREQLDRIASELLGVDLAAVKEAMLP